MILATTTTKATTEQNKFLKTQVKALLNEAGQHFILKVCENFFFLNPSVFRSQTVFMKGEMFLLAMECRGGCGGQENFEAKHCVA